jgi:NAD(P)H-hydrate epimerase
MSGAACLAGLGALRGGAGLVYLAVPMGILSIVAGAEPSYLTIPLPEDDQGRISTKARPALEAVSRTVTAVAMGPGWGLSDDLVELARWLYSTVDVPTVVDADALNALAVSGELPSSSFPRILTPHPGEFARLTKSDIANIQQNREEMAVEFARNHGVIVLLKGHHTVVTDGRRIAVNPTGNNGMATGGAGDVLTGLVAALLAQKMPPFEAAQLGAYLHGLAGDLAAEQHSTAGLIASDLPQYLGKAWKSLNV